MADVIVKKGDTSPIVGPYTLTDSSGNAVNLTGATSVTFVMRTQTALAPSLNAAATVNNAAGGIVQYTFTTADTGTSGVYQGEFHYALASGTTGTWPLDGYLEISVEEDLVTKTTVGRLVNLGMVKDWLRIPASDRSHDSQLTRLIDTATPIIEGITGPILQREYQNETYDGGFSYISLRHRPVISVQSVVEYRGPIPYNLQQVPTPDLGSIYSFMFEPPGRIVRRTVGGGITPFPPGYDQVFVSYTAGYFTVPHNVETATLELIRANWQPTQQGLHPAFGGAVDQGEEFATAPPPGFFVPNRVRELLEPNRRHPSIA